MVTSKVTEKIFDDNVVATLRKNFKVNKNRRVLKYNKTVLIYKKQIYFKTN